jgi:hypothetical protein
MSACPKSSWTNLGFTPSVLQSHSSLILHIGRYVAVSIHRPRDGGVFKPLLGELGVDALREHERSAGMPKVVEADGAQSSLGKQLDLLRAFYTSEA